jgi:NAD-dependent deacetylase
VRDPSLVWRFYSERRKGALPCLPNAGHHALAEVERNLGERFLLATQNVDGLHVRAGSERVVEMHGNLFTTRCSKCSVKPFYDEAEHVNAVPVCGACGKPLRPHIVWFGEALQDKDLKRIEQFINRAAKHTFVFLAVGTSGLVYPAANLVNVARHVGGTSVMVNADAPENIARFDRFVQGKSGEILPEMFAYV